MEQRNKLEEPRLIRLAMAKETPKLLATLEFMKKEGFTLKDVRMIAELLYDGTIATGWLLDELSNNQPISTPQTIIDYLSSIQKEQNQK